MQPLKKLLSWVSGIALVVGAGIEALQSAGIVFDPASPVGKFVMLLGVVVLVARNLTADKDGDGIPDILQPGDRDGSVRVELLLLLVGAALFVVACGGAQRTGVMVSTLSAPSDSVAFRLVANPPAGQRIYAARWKVTADEFPAGTFPDALEAVVRWAKPAPMTCTTFRYVAWALRRDAQSNAVRVSKDSTVGAWQECTGDTDPPALDSVSVIRVTLPVE